MSSEDRIHELYGLPLTDFVSARNDLARELKDEGDKDGAERETLQKPSVAAWAVNQLARKQPKRMAELMSLRDRLRSAHSAAELREASTERHQLISDLVDEAAGILESVGSSASSQTLSKVSSTLYGGANDDELRALENGTLTRELEPAGFEGSAELDWSVGPDADERSPKRATKEQQRREHLEDELVEAEAAAEELVRNAKAARRSADAAESEAKTAVDRVERLRARLGRILPRD